MGRRRDGEEAASRRGWASPLRVLLLPHAVRCGLQLLHPPAPLAPAFGDSSAGSMEACSTPPPWGANGWRGGRVPIERSDAGVVKGEEESSDNDRVAGLEQDADGDRLAEEVVHHQRRRRPSRPRQRRGPRRRAARRRPPRRGPQQGSPQPAPSPVVGLDAGTSLAGARSASRSSRSASLLPRAARWEHGRDGAVLGRRRSSFPSRSSLAASWLEGVERGGGRRANERAQAPPSHRQLHGARAR